METLGVVIPRRDPLTGTGFRARRRLGGGASSEIFEAEGPNGRVCAVKVLRTMHLDTRDATEHAEGARVVAVAVAVVVVVVCFGHLQGLRDAQGVDPQWQPRHTVPGVLP